MIRILARKVPWIDRKGSRLKWLGINEETGEALTVATEYPLSDAAMVLLERGEDPKTPIAMRHEGSGHDSFEPMALWIVAAPSQRRAKAAEEFRDRMARQRKEKGDE